ncbi:hypothetical protein Q4575_05720 [Psychrosphaera sp. 1_MG-2023]|uniref:hypothetical protein n=1 Tax=Psychrosphaera sp. 1_MG-2023 TaxID=3062643 RepID=UPI0026E36233|nr:hypothetical protein [Psychrosphaera sp. 1_MG-2023]MDO6718889.1 hypothetical protein [Psychrosphaera sp. 1_MG-2023]
MSIKTKNMKKLFLATCVTTALVGLQACNADDPDVGDSSAKSAFGGRLIDGYLAGATIYIDLNRNNRRNAGEPYAITDKDGYFSESKEGVNYCREGAPENESRHCLNSVLADSDVLIRTYGGFDVATGEPFTGSLSREVKVSTTGVVNNSVVSPLTTALAAAEDKEKLLADLGITESDLDVDFLSEDEFSSALTGKALGLHKVATAFSEVVDSVYTEFGEDSDLPSNSYELVYKGLVNNAPADGVWTEADLFAAFEAAEQTAIDLYVGAGLSNAAVAPEDIVAAVNGAKVILGVIGTSFSSETTFDNLNQNLLGVELVTTKIVYEKAESDEVDTIVNELGDPGSNLNQTLSNVNADFQGLAKTKIDDSTDYDSLVVVDPQNLGDPIDKQLSINYEDEDASGAFHIFFKGTEGSSSGTLVTCLTYTTTDQSELDDSDFDLEDVNTAGNWFNIDAKSMVVTLTFGGGNYDVVLASKGLDAEQRQKYSFSYGGENVSWYSNNGLIANDDTNALPVPVSNDDCSATLGD